MIEARGHFLKFKGFEPDRMAAFLANGELEHYLLSASSCDVSHQRWTCQGVTIDRGHYSFPVRTLGAFPKGRICVGYMRHLSEPTWVNGYLADVGTLEVYGEGSELNYRAGANGEWVAISVPCEALQEARQGQLGRGLRLPDAGVVSFRVPGQVRRELDARVCQLMKRSRVSQAALGSFVGLLAEILSHLGGDEADALLRKAQRRLRVVQRADACLHERLGQPFRSQELARAVGVGERSLQRHFQEAFGLSPRSWARCLALHRARELMLSADARSLCIEGLAREAGFGHVGRFAGYYRELFGECPSETLARCRG